MREGGGKGTSSGNPFVMDDRAWPLVRITSPRVDLNVDSFFEIIDACMARGPSFATVHDIRGMPGLTALQRKQFADYIRSKERQLKRHILAHGVVVKSAIERGIVTAVLWVSPVPFPVKVFDSMAEAELWVKGELGRRR